MIKLYIHFSALCDNQTYVNILSWLLKDDYHHHCLHKSTEYEALRISLDMLPNIFLLSNTYMDTRTNINYDQLPIKTQLNIDADTVTTKNSYLPINTHVISTLYDIY